MVQPKPTRKQKQRKRSAVVWPWSCLLCVFNLHYLTMLTGLPGMSLKDQSVGHATVKNVANSGGPALGFDGHSKTVHLPTCTDDQLRIIKNQLKPERCEETRNKQWLQRCSFTQATKCPDPVWLQEFHKTRTRSAGTSFLSYFVGCNKAIDAVNALRVGSNNAIVDVLKWQEQLQKGGVAFAGSSCAQFNKRQVEVPSNGVNDAQVHCFEPITSTFTEINRTKRELGWGDELILVHGAFSSAPGNLSVPTFDPSQAVGIENADINKMSRQCSDPGTAQPGKCMDVPIMTLDDYHRQHGHGKVHYISIDVEGFDALVLKNHVSYVEFEYNWKGPWLEVPLSSVVSNLKDIGFTCYWPGTNGEIWRITGCWLDHYDIHHWSNVACVNQNDEEATHLATRMEGLFLETLQKKDVMYI